MEFFLPHENTNIESITESRHNGGHNYNYYIYVNDRIRETLGNINAQWLNDSDRIHLIIYLTIKNKVYEKK